MDYSILLDAGLLIARFLQFWFRIYGRPEDSYYWPVDVSDLITVDPEILGGTPVFKGTRVPVKTVFDYLENNYNLEEFLECFPSVTSEMARRVLKRSETMLLSPA
jgi:uncharacterized protein (DUF433 family)